MATNLVLNLQALGMEHYLVLANEASTCDWFLSQGVITGCAWSSILELVPSSVWNNWKFGDASRAGNRFLNWWMRWQVLAKIGELGYNVLVTDSDVVYHSDPYPHFKVNPCVFSSAYE
jgi:hypothetical protein